MSQRKNYILICEDSLDTITLLKFFLEEQGYRVEPTQSVFEAIAKLKEETPDLLITDLMLPDYNGFELINHVRHTLKITNLPILVISAFGQKFQVDEKLFFLPKPLDISFFAKTVNQILSAESSTSGSAVDRMR